MPNPSCICNPRLSPRQHWIPNLSKARDRIYILRDAMSGSWLAEPQREHLCIHLWMGPFVQRQQTSLKHLRLYRPHVVSVAYSSFFFFNDPLKMGTPFSAQGSFRFPLWVTVCQACSGVLWQGDVAPNCAKSKATGPWKPHLELLLENEVGPCRWCSGLDSPVWSLFHFPNGTELDQISILHFKSGYFWEEILIRPH